MPRCSLSKRRGPLTTDDPAGHAPGRNGWLVPLLLVVLAMVPRLALLLILSPASDVFYVDREAARVLIAGNNPYDHTFTTIPPALATSGAAHVFAYLPFTAIYLVPFYL